MTFLLLGIALLILVLRDVFQAVVVPRGKATGFRIPPVLVHNIVWPPFRWAASMTASPVWKAEVLGAFAPFVLMALLTTWVCLLIGAFGLISFGLAGEYSPAIESPLSALYVAGSSVLTLGTTEYVARTGTTRLLMLAGAFLGIIVTASVVSLMFGLIGSIQRREVLVSITTNVAGSPPSGIAILETYSFMNGRRSLDRFFEHWHLWCADVLETHKAYPILPYFRSNDPLTSWLTALGATLDSVALLLSVDSGADCFSAKVTYQFGCMLLADLASSWHLEMAKSQEPDNDEFHSLYLRLKAAGYCSKDEDHAKKQFARLRQEYLPAYRALCDFIAAPPAPLSVEYRLQLPILGSSP